MIRIRQKGDFKATTELFNRIGKGVGKQNLDVYGRKGVEALSAATPVDTGLTAASWYYEVKRDKSGITIQWLNSNIQNGVNVALIIQLGHGTKSGGYVQGRDYINPAVRPIFDEMAETVWKEVSGG